ncbi:MAG: cysteine synthase CysM [Flavobacteriaceae bacterium]
MIYENITKSIGSTPLIDASALTRKSKVKLFLKLEGHNPGGSVKDRAAYNMIQSALNRNAITKSDVLIEATSGNTGIALALIASVLNMHIKIVMSEGASKERILTMRALGADVILTPAKQGIEGARDHAAKLRDQYGYFMLNQFENDDNWKAHFKTTGPEIWKDTKGGVTHFVSAMGTTGTIMGVSNFLKQKNNHIKIIGAQPKDGDSIPGIRRWSKDYVPKIYNPKRVDRIMDVSKEQAVKTSRLLASSLGIFSGMSSGGAVHVALNLANELEKGIIVAIVCDRGDRYLTTDLYQ